MVNPLGFLPWARLIIVLHNEEEQALGREMGSSNIAAHYATLRVPMSPSPSMSWLTEWIKWNETWKTLRRYDKLTIHLNYYYQQLFVYSSEIEITTICIFLMRKLRFTELVSFWSWIQMQLYPATSTPLQSPPALRFQTAPLWHNFRWCRQSYKVGPLSRYLECTRHWLQGQWYSGKQKTPCLPLWSLWSVTETHRSNQQAQRSTIPMWDKCSKACSIQYGSHWPCVYFNSTLN